MISSFRRFYGYLRKDSMLLYKRKKYLYLFILLPLVIAGLFLFALNPGDYNITVGVCDFDNTDISRASYSSLDGFNPLILELEGCHENLRSLIESGEVDLGLVIDKGFSSRINGLDQASLIVYYDNTNVAFANLVSWKVDVALNPFKREIINALSEELTGKASNARTGLDLLFEFDNIPNSVEKRALLVDRDLEKVEGLDTEFILNPVVTDQRPIYDAELKKDAGIVFVFPLLALFVMLMLSSTSLIYDKNNHFITRVKSSSSPFSYLLAKVLFFTVLVAVQFLIILLLFMMYGARYTVSPSLIHLILFIGVIDALIGIIIGLVANNEGIAVLFSLMVSFPLMLISGVFFPVQALPGFTRWFSSILPLQYQISASKSVLLFGQSLSFTWWWFALVLFIFAYWGMRKIQ